VTRCTGGWIASSAISRLTGKPAESSCRQRVPCEPAATLADGYRTFRPIYYYWQSGTALPKKPFCSAELLRTGPVIRRQWTPFW
jgi:hypothetical protein